MLVAYITAHFPSAHIFYHVRLGSIPNIPIAGLDFAAARRVLSLSLPEVDAIVLNGSDVYLIEAKIAKEWDNLGKMLIYRYLLPITAGWEKVNVAAIKLLMILGRATPLLVSTASAMGVSLVVAPTPRVTEILTLGYPSQR
jgi:hypothetical protein